jgi:hypothetical protein
MMGTRNELRPDIPRRPRLDDGNPYCYRDLANARVWQFIHAPKRAQAVKDLIIGAIFGLSIGAACLPGLLHSAKKFCDLGYSLCVERPVTSHKCPSPQASGTESDNG